MFITPNNSIDTKGFTLFETLIYIALFTFIMGGAILSAYQIFEGSAQIQRMAEREVELNFVLRKIDWAINGADTADFQRPNTSMATSSTLRILKDGDVLEFGLHDGVVVLTDDPLGSATDYELTSSRIDITSLAFAYIDAQTDILEITMTVDGDTVGPITKFIR